MDAAIADLRLLHLALRLEEGMDAIQGAIHRHLPPGPLKDELAKVLGEGPAHDRLQRSYEQANRRLEAVAGELGLQALLQALHDGERLACDFYTKHARELSTPGLQALFRALAEEEAGHAALAGRALEESLLKP